MNWTPLPCGIHEARRELDTCPVCEWANRENERELAKVVIDRSARRLQDARIKRNREAKMALPSRYTDEQKTEALRRLGVGQSAKAIGRDLGCSEGLIYLWRKQAGEKLNQTVERTEKTKAAKKTKAQPKKPRTKSERAPPATLDVETINKRVGAILERPYPDLVEPPSRPYTVAAPSRFAHEDVIAFLAKLPPVSWPLGDAIRLLSFHAIDGDFDDVQQARERIDAYLRAKEVA